MWIYVNSSLTLAVALVISMALTLLMSPYLAWPNVSITIVALLVGFIAAMEVVKLSNLKPRSAEEEDLPVSARWTRSSADAASEASRSASLAAVSADEACGYAAKANSLSGFSAAAYAVVSASNSAVGAAGAAGSAVAASTIAVSDLAKSAEAAKSAVKSAKSATSSAINACTDAAKAVTALSDALSAAANPPDTSLENTSKEAGGADATRQEDNDIPKHE